MPLQPTIMPSIRPRGAVGLATQPWPQIRNLGGGPDDSIPNNYDKGMITALQGQINTWLKSHGYNLIGTDDNLGHETCRACLYVLGQLDGTVDRCPGECPNSDENWTPTKASSGSSSSSSSSSGTSTTTTPPASKPAASSGSSLGPVLIGGGIGLGVLAALAARKKHSRRRR